MDKKEEKKLVAETCKLLEDLVSKNSLTPAEVDKLSKLLQKATSKGKNQQKDIEKFSEFISTKPELKEFLDKDKEKNMIILTRATQKFSSEHHPSPQQPVAKSETSAPKNDKKTLFNIENWKNCCEKWKYEGDEGKKIFVFFEKFSDNDNKEMLPMYTWIYSPEEKKILIIIKKEERINLNFAQVNYIFDEDQKYFQDIKYFSMVENGIQEENETKEYKGNVINMKKLENELKNCEINNGNNLEVKYISDDQKEYKNIVKKICEEYKEKNKIIKTSDKNYLGELIKE